MKVLVTGASGYIGGRLIPRLLAENYDVRVFARSESSLKRKKWFSKVEVAIGDLEEQGTLTKALEGIDAAYFLVHSMYDGSDFAEKEAAITANFAEAAKKSGVKKIIYLGGLLPEGEISEHLQSRANVGRILAEHCPTTEFRAGPIIGSGSASFEMIRYLTERLPVLIVPAYLQNKVQAIAVEDVLSYLTAALKKEPKGIVDIGSDPLSFVEMLEVYAKVRGLNRKIYPVSFVPIWVAGSWISLITPLPMSLTMPLVKGIVHPILGKAFSARRHFPEIVPLQYKEAVQKALDEIKNRQVISRWLSPRKRADVDETYEVANKEGVVKEVRVVQTKATPESVFRAFMSVGGEKGWLAWNWAWQIRGFMDSLVGGPGLKRGRRDSDDLEEGDALDFWRVEKIDEPHLLRLKAEMKVPGKAWLQWETENKDGQTALTQTALFVPKGFFGQAYWYAMYPAHLFLFGDMARKIVKTAEELEKGNEEVTGETPRT